MKPMRFVLSAAALLGAVVAVVACSSSDDSGPPVEQANGVCGTSMSMGEGAQDDCVNASCCTEFVACNDDAACAACLGGQGEGCESDALLASFWSCFEANHCDSPAGTGGAGGEAGAAGAAGSAGTGGGGQTCEGSQIECGGKCVDTQTDGANCGTCGHDCLGAACTAGACAPEVLSDAEYVNAMALDADNVYYTQFAALPGGVSEYSLRKLAKSGGTPEVLNGELGGEVNELYLHDGKLYWPHDEAFHYVPVSGGQTTDVPASFSFIYSRFEFAKGSAYGVGACSNIYRYSMTDGSHVQMTKDGCNVFGGTEPFALAPDGATAFVVFDKPNSVHELWNVKPPSGSHTVIDKALNADELQYDNGIVYFVLGGKVGRIDANGANRKVIGDPAKAAPGEGLTKASGIRIRDGKVYYQAYKSDGPSAVIETELDGSASRVVARHTEHLKVWDVDDKYVLFATDDGLMRAVK